MQDLHESGVGLGLRPEDEGVCLSYSMPVGILKEDPHIPPILATYGDPKP